jgi:hypothetical protein
MHRGFHAFHFVRGQERDFFRPQTPASKKKIEEALIGGPSGRTPRRSCCSTTPTPWAAERGGLVLAAGLRQGDGVPGGGQGRPAVLHGGGQLRPARALGPAREVHEPLQRRLRRPEPVTSSSGPSDWLTDAQRDRMEALYSAR